ncbi:glycosyltransferase family 2 protein [Winogradskyella rapida]|uniref:Glycosyltransferase family 2 protein n=1 Tax=Winogradskyella rapida TaxID=549701 RepID=A0ABW3KMZ5_9FLAO
MSTTPLVSIIIPTYNRAHLIGETLDSVLSQTYTNWECIVVDDGSTDGTAALMATYLEKDSRFQYHNRPDTYLPGGNGARNYGFEVSKGKYVQWFDDDDVMLFNFLKVKLFAFSEGIDLVICSCKKVDKSLKETSIVDLKIKTILYRDYVLWNFKIVTNNVTFRRCFLDNTELFNPEILRGQETEFFSRIFYNLSQEQCVIINKPLFLYRQHGSTKSAENKVYVSDYKFSQSYINIENLKRAIEIRDCQLINRCFQTLMVYFFMSLKHGDYNTAAFIYKHLGPILKHENKSVFMEFKFVCGSMFRFKLYSYRINKRWKTMELC